MRATRTTPPARGHRAADRKSRGIADKILLAAGAAVAVTALGAWTPATAAVRSPARSLTETFGYVGNRPQEVIVPPGVTAATLRVIGGMGGGNKQTGSSSRAATALRSAARSRSPPERC